MPSLSQRYRPKTFAEITGQTSVTETLRKEVASQMLGHAYVFSGPRGVGKTTAARVFAKALNCLEPKNGEPCNACAMCVAANEGRLIDLIELDAATHTGVDTVREAIVEHVRFAPAQGKRKVYILDEAHMLSTSSWNALLKTLEEPPPYAFFILATTEVHKVPATIVSRCQRFEFRRIPDDLLSARLHEIAASEGWKVDEAAVALIVSRSEGCLRDAETLLGQIGALGESKITIEVANLVIPPSHLPEAAGLMRLWATRDHQASQAEIQRLFDEGLPFLTLFDDLLLIIRKLLSAAGNPGLVETWRKGFEADQSLATIANAFTPGELHDLALVLLERRRDVKSGVDPLFAVQLAGTLVANGLLRNSDRSVTPTATKEPVPPVKPTAIKLPKEEKPATPPPISKQDDILKVNDQSPVTPSTLDLATVRGKWQSIIRAVDEKNHSLPFILKISRVEEVRGNVVVLRFQYPFHRDKIIGDIKHRRIVEECARAVLGCEALTIDGIVGEDSEVQEQRKEDMVSNILKAFGGQVVEENP